MKSLAAVLLLTAFLRLFQISSTPAGLYWDELDTGYQAYSLLSTGRDYFGNLLPAHLQSFADYRSGLYMYLTVPFIKLFGLSSFSVRAPAVLISLLTAVGAYLFAAFVLKLGRYSWILSLVIISAPWTLVQGRVAAESQLLVPFLLLSLTGFFKRNYSLTAFFLGLSFWAYPTAKLFVPVFILLLYIIYRRSLAYRDLLLPGLIFILVAFLPFYETVFMPVGRRFSEVSVMTDPTIAKQVEIGRLYSYLGRGGDYHVGLETGLVDRLAYNKFTYWGSKILSNYASSLSTGFLFTSGDPNLRHHLNPANTGQFYLIEIIPFVIGLLYVSSSFGKSSLSRFLLLWLLLSPLPSVITRDGGNHAPRLIFMLVPVASLIALGTARIAGYRKYFSLYALLFICSLIFTGYYLFSVFRIESASAFNSGFIRAADLAIREKKSYDQVILDGANESLLMAYLFATGFPPREFQSSFPLPSKTVTNGVEGYLFDNIVILYPGTRDWNSLNLTGNNLIIASSIQPNISNVNALSLILKPDSTPAFTVFETNIP